MPAVVVVRKLYGGSSGSRVARPNKRIWRLERLPVTAGAEEQQPSKKTKVDANADDMDEEDFMQEVEADKDMRLNMNLYKSDLLKKKSEAQDEDAMNDDDDNDDADEDSDDDQQIKLDELLDGLALETGPDEDDVPQQFFFEGEKAAEQGAIRLAEASQEEHDHVMKNIMSRIGGFRLTGWGVVAGDGAENIAAGHPRHPAVQQTSSRPGHP